MVFENIKKNVSRYLLLLLFICALSSCANVKAKDKGNIGGKAEIETDVNVDDIFDVEHEKKVEKKELYEIAKDSKVVYVGETHDNYSGHKVQLEVIQNLYKVSSGSLAIGLEMFQRRSQEKLDLWTSGRITEKEFLKDVWYPDWGYEYEYYREIIEFAKKNRIKLVALNMDEALVRKINDEGIDNLSDDEKKLLPEIDLTDELHRKRVKAVFDVHGQGSMGDFDKFYMTQCLWDETMAESAANFLKSKEGKGKQLVVLAGKDHVRYGLGIPKRVYRRYKQPYTIILPIEISIPDNKKHNIMNVEQVEVPVNEADYFWMVEYTDPVIERVKLGVVIINSGRGVIAHEIEDGSSAAKIGIKSGDVIVDVDGVEIKDPFDLVYEIRNKTAGKTGQIRVEREGKELTFDILYELGIVE